MKERPILFKPEMVRAVLDGKKTQTRRVVKMPARGAFVLIEHADTWWPYQSDDGESELCNDGNEHPMNCPYGLPGDRLWVRETWRPIPTKGGRRKELGRDDVIYAADGLGGVQRRGIAGARWKWKPSIFMPRWASRIKLDVTGVRVERLQDISEEDAIVEGTRCWVCDGPVDGSSENDCSCFHTKKLAVDSFQVLWDSINGKRKDPKTGKRLPYAWDENPWVWCPSFKLVTP